MGAEDHNFRLLEHLAIVVVDLKISHAGHLTAIVNRNFGRVALFGRSSVLPVAMA